MKRTLDYPTLARALAVAGLALLAAGCGAPEDRVAQYVADARQLYETDDLVNASLELRNALQLEPRNARARYLKALIEERSEDYRDVVANLQIAVESDPDYLEARVKLGNYHAVAGRLAETRVQADAALKLAPESASVRLLSARALYLEGRKAEAQQEAREALRIDPRRQDAVTLDASLSAEAGRIGEALATIDGAVAAAGKANSEGLRRVRVTLLAEAGDPAEAERELQSLAADFPDAAAYDFALARLYSRQGRPADAEARIRKLIDRDPDNAAWRIQLAGLMAGQDRQADAEASLREALAASPESTTLRLALGGFHESAGRLEDARAAYREVVALTPRSGDGLAARNRLVALDMGTDDAAARALIRSILADAPDNVDALLSRAAYHVRDNQLDEAIADLNSALARQPDSPRALLLQARVHVLGGQGDLAEKAYRRLLDTDPGNRDGRKELATLVGNRGDTGEAATLLRDSLRLDPADPEASANLVKALLMERDFAGAEAESRRMVALGEPSGQADYQLGRALEAQGQDDRAMAAYRQSLARSPLAAEPLEALVAALRRTRRAGEAEGFLRAHLAAHPGHTPARLLLGELYRAGNRPAEARAVLAAVAAEQPTNASAYLGLAALEPEGSDARLAVLQEAHGRVPGSPAIGLALGAALEKREAFDQAIDVYETVVRAGGASEFLLDNLAVLLLDNRSDGPSHARALDLLRPYAARSAARPETVGILGWAYYRNGQYPTARRYLERAVAAVPAENPQLRYYLGMTLLKAGDAAGARSALQLAVRTAGEAGVRFKGLAEAEDELRKLAPQPG